MSEHLKTCFVIIWLSCIISDTNAFINSFMFELSLYRCLSWQKILKSDKKAKKHKIFKEYNQLPRIFISVDLASVLAMLRGGAVRCYWMLLKYQFFTMFIRICPGCGLVRALPPILVCGCNLSIFIQFWSLLHQTSNWLGGHLGCGNTNTNRNIYALDIYYLRRTLPNIKFQPMISR